MALRGRSGATALVQALRQAKVGNKTKICEDFCSGLVSGSMGLVFFIVSAPIFIHTYICIYIYTHLNHHINEPICRQLCHAFNPMGLVLKDSFLHNDIHKITDIDEFFEQK